jgi:hypothetical protein
MFDIASKPRYIHDCDNCLFLGCYKEFDIYWCQGSSSFAGGSVIARYGSEGRKYSSSPVSMIFYADLADNVLFKAAQYLLYQGYVKLHINQEKIDEDKNLYEDLWNMRKKS